MAAGFAESLLQTPISNIWIVLRDLESRNHRRVFSRGCCVVQKEFAVLLELRMKGKSEQSFSFLAVLVDASFVDIQEHRGFFNRLVVRNTLMIPSCSATNTRLLPSPRESTTSGVRTSGSRRPVRSRDPVLSQLAAERLPFRNSALPAKPDLHIFQFAALLAPLNSATLCRTAFWFTSSQKETGTQFQIFSQNNCR